MDRRNLILGGAGLLGALLFAAPATARIVSQAPVGDEADITEEVKRGGKGRGGRGRGWAASRGRKRGWHRGRGNAWGRRRNFGW